MGYKIVRLASYAVLAGSVCFALSACVKQRSVTENSEAAAIADLQAQVAELKDRQQIHDMYLRYMRGFDRNDIDLLKSAFWPDVQINYGTKVYSLDAFINRHLNRHVALWASWGHLITNETVDIDGDTAHVETYVTALFRAKHDNKSFVNGATILGGRYVDRLERRNGHWRIAMREFIPHFWTKDNVMMEAYSKELAAHAPCALGTWDKNDLSYRRPLSIREEKTIGPECAK